MTHFNKGALRCVSAVAVLVNMGFLAHADDFTIKLGGRLQVDYTSAQSDNAGLDIDSSELRRARLKASGQFKDGLKYKFEVSTNDSKEISIEDAYLEFKPSGSALKIKAGQFKTQNSLDEQTSSLDISVIERAAFTDAFEFNRRLGVELSTSGTNYTLNAGIFGANLADIDDDDDSLAVAARGTYKIDLEGGLVHLGASMRYRDQNDSGNIRYRQRPFTHDSGRIISTGTVADKDTFYGLEAAGLFGPAWVSGEYAITKANCVVATCTSDPTFTGTVFEAGYVFGGQRNYKGGKFKRVSVDKTVTDGGWGAMSLVARYDHLDLTSSGVNGGDMDTVVVGADWWLTQNARLMFNYFKSDATLGTSTSGLDSAFAAAVSNPLITDDKVDGFVARLQFDF